MPIAAQHLEPQAAEAIKNETWHARTVTACQKLMVHVQSERQSPQQHKVESTFPFHARTKQITKIALRA